MTAAQRSSGADGREEARPAQQRDHGSADGDRVETRRRQRARVRQALVQGHGDRRSDARPEREAERDVALDLALASGRGHLDRQRVERRGPDAERHAGEHAIGQHDPRARRDEQRTGAREHAQGEHERDPPPERVDDPATERAHAQLGDARDAEREADGAGIVALVVQEQRQHGEHAEMTRRPQEQPAGEGEDVAREGRAGVHRHVSHRRRSGRLSSHRGVSPGAAGGEAARRPVTHLSVTRAFTASTSSGVTVSP